MSRCDSQPRSSDSGYPISRNALAPSYRVETPPAGKYDSFYKKYLSAEGFSILSSGRVSDYALLEAAYLIDQMLIGRDDIRQALLKKSLPDCNVVQ